MSLPIRFADRRFDMVYEVLLAHLRRVKANDLQLVGQDPSTVLLMLEYGGEEVDVPAQLD